MSGHFHLFALKSSFAHKRPLNSTHFQAAEVPEKQFALNSSQINLSSGPSLIKRLEPQLVADRLMGRANNFGLISVLRLN